MGAVVGGVVVVGINDEAEDGDGVTRFADADGDTLVRGEPGLVTVGAYVRAVPGVGDVHQVGVVGPRADVVAQAV